jgi:hypothetical protein
MATMERSEALPSVRRARRLGGPALFFKTLRFVLRDFFRSAWVLLAIGTLVAMHLLLLNESPSRSHFFGVQYASTILIAAIAAAAMFTRANRAEMYPILARPVSRLALTGVLMLAAWLVTVVAYLLSSAVTLVRYGPWLEHNAPVSNWADVVTLARGSLPMLVIALVVVCVVALLSTFVSPSLLRLVILSFIALLIMSFDNRNFPIEGIRPALQALPPVMAPVAGALRYATESAPDTLAAVELGMLAGYAFFLLLIVLWLSSSHETVLD